MRRLRFATALLCALLLGTQAVAAQSPEPLPSPTEAPRAEPLPNSGRPLTHDELLAFRGEMADPDQLVTVVADTVIERERARASERGPVIGTLPREGRYPGDPAVEASKVVRARYRSTDEPSVGLAALYITQDMRLRGHVATPAGTYLTPIAPEVMATAGALPEGALLVANGWLSELVPTSDCPQPPRALEVQRLGGGSPFLDCPAGWLTPDPLIDTSPGDPLSPAQFGIRVQHGAAGHFGQRGDAATYLLRHIVNPVAGALPTLGWEVLARLDTIEIPAAPAPLTEATSPTGLGWQPVVERQPPADTAPVMGSNGMLTTAWADGFASVTQGRDHVAATWVSPDGSSWRSASLPNGIGQVEALLPLRDGLALIADSNHQYEDGATWRFTVWRSTDGLTWRRVKQHTVRTPERFASPYYRIVQGFWSTGDRLVAHETYTTNRCCGDAVSTTFVSAAADDEPVTYAWTSRDGRTWTRKRVEGLSVADGWHYRDAIHPTGDSLYALAGPPTYGIDYSRDGVRWQTVGRQPTGLVSHDRRVFLRTKDGFVIGGTLAEPRTPGDRWRHSTTLWHSPDADRWTEAHRSEGGPLVDLAAAGDIVVAASGFPVSPEPEGSVSRLLASRDGGRTWTDGATSMADTSWCLRGLTAAGPGILLDVACPPPDAASRYLHTVVLQPEPEPEPTPPPVTTVRSAREAVRCDIGGGTHTRGFGGGGDEDPRVAMQRMVRSGTVVPVRGYKVLERDENAVLYGFRNGDEVKVAARVKRDGGRWRPDGLSRCALAEFGPSADMGRGVWLWADADGRTVQERKGPELCGWGSMRILYLTARGKPENMRQTREYVRDPAGDVRDLWQSPYLKRSKLPRDAEFTGYRRDGAWLWLAADGDAAYVIRGNQVEQWPLVEPGGIGCA